MLVQGARSECAPWTRAVKPTLPIPPVCIHVGERSVKKLEESRLLLGRFEVFDRQQAEEFHAERFYFGAAVLFFAVERK